jgi:hypothetical protein
MTSKARQTDYELTAGRLDALPHAQLTAAAATTTAAQASPRSLD